MQRRLRAAWWATVNAVCFMIVALMVFFALRLATALGMNTASEAGLGLTAVLVWIYYYNKELSDG